VRISICCCPVILASASVQSVRVIPNTSCVSNLSRDGGFQCIIIIPCSTHVRRSSTTPRRQLNGDRKARSWAPTDKTHSTIVLQPDHNATSWFYLFLAFVLCVTLTLECS
jgi:hypothetical protein